MKKNIILFIICFANMAFGQVISYKGFLPPRMTTTQRDAINPKPAGLMIFNTTTKCMENWNTTKWVSKCSADGTILELKCSTAVHTGQLISGTDTPPGVYSDIEYTGGNGGTHNGQIVTSTGVIGLTATLAAGNFNNGNGTLTYTITGTPTSSGTASFTINIGGQSCTFTRNVVAGSGSIVTLDCNNPTHTGGTLTSGVALPSTGITSSIPYTGGNGGPYNGQTVQSTGVLGLTATLAAGNFNNGNGTLTYTITGTPTSSGTASFTINIGGQSCTLTRNVETGVTFNLKCADKTVTGALANGVSAYNVSFNIPYDGGNGSSHGSQIVPSTGVSGLTATLNAGNFANGSGSLTYTITGTPNSIGTAHFAVNIGGQNCDITIEVNDVNKFKCPIPYPQTGYAGRHTSPYNNKDYYICVHNSNGVLAPYRYTCQDPSIFDKNDGTQNSPGLTGSCRFP